MARIDRMTIRPPARGQPKVVAVFSFRYDAHLVPDLLANIAPAVHGWVALDDRAADVALTDETARRRAVLQAAAAEGADWILACDPDERFESRLADRIGAMVAERPGSLWVFNIREMFTPTAYRVDGFWGGKEQPRLFPLAAARRDFSKVLHDSWVQSGGGFAMERSGLNLYHLRPAHPARRAHRRATYAAADPDRRSQSIGYDYLDDERGMVLEEIPPGRGYAPAFVEDGGLWAPDVGRIGAVLPDPPAVRLTYLARAGRQRAAAAAAPVLSDLRAADPGDEDLAALDAGLAFIAGDHARVEDAAAALSGCAFALTTRASAALTRAGPETAAPLLSAAETIAGDSAWLRHLAGQAATGAARLSAADAPWRRWTAGPATLTEGADVGRGPLAIVVIGHRAPSVLRDAVQSALDQEGDPEVVVVNSDGGDLAARLRGLEHRLRVIDVADRLFVGAARNIGVDATHARWIAFLAGDCRARPGWASARVVRHGAGAATVANPVVSRRPGRLISQASSTYRHSRRRPTIDAALASPYGRSYDRRLFLQLGYFAPGLRIGEDTAFNRRADRLAAPEWASEILTDHDDPVGLLTLVRDMRRRSARYGFGGPNLVAPTPDEALRRLQETIARKHRYGREALAETPAGPIRRWLLARLHDLIAGVEFQATAKALARRTTLERRIAAALATARADPAKAEQTIAAAVAENPQGWRGHFALARARLSRDPVGRAEDALMALRAAMAIAPEEPGPLVQAVAVLTRLGRGDEALAWAEEAVILAPHAARLRLVAAGAALAVGRLPLALLHARAALVSDPAAADVHDRLAEIHAARGRPDLATRRRAMAAALRARSG